MAHRSGQDQEAHDRGVQAEARDLDRKGWNVRADIAGWPAVPKVGSRYPDVYATKRGGARIVEIETDPGDDHRQHKVFRRSAGQTGANFYGWIVDSGGNRRQKFD